MSTKHLMVASSIVMGALGVTFSFLPQEVLTYVGVSSQGMAPLFLQVAGGLYVAFAMINWMTRASVIGGIYNRPLAMGNFIHFFMGALALIKGFRAVPASVVVITATVVYSIFAIWFGIVLFTHPSSNNGVKN